MAAPDRLQQCRLYGRVVTANRLLDRALGMQHRRAPPERRPRARPLQQPGHHDALRARRTATTCNPSIVLSGSATGTWAPARRPSNARATGAKTEMRAADASADAGCTSRTVRVRPAGCST